MNALLGVAVIGLAGLAAIRATAGLLQDRRSRVLAMATIFFAIFLGAFLWQGFIELATGRPVIGLPLAVAFAAVCLVATFVRRPTPSGSRTVDDGTSRRWRTAPRVAAAAVLVVFVACAVLLVAGGVPHGYEVKAYHLPLAIRVLRDGTLHLWDRSFMHAYPVNMSVWAGFFLVLIPERLVSIVNLPFLLLLAIAVYSLCRAVGGDRSAALLVTAGVATIPIIGFSALEIGADVAGVAFIAIATYLVIVRPGGPSFPYWIAGLAAGMAYGFKSLHLVPAAALGLLLLFEGIVGRRRRLASPRGSFEALVPVLAFTSAALAMMSFWLIRNWVEAGNPLYPVHVHGLFDLLGWKAAPDFDLRTRSVTETEWVDASWKWLLYPWVEGNFVNQNFKHSSGLGAFFAATVPVVVLLWPLHLLVDRPARSPVTRAQAVSYGLAALVAAAWCVLGDRQPRYVMTSIVLLCPIAAWLLTLATGRLRTRYEALLTVCIATMALVLGVKLAATNGATLIQNPHAARRDWLEYPAAIDRLPAGSLIANGVDREVNYLLLGEGLQNHVIDAGEVLRRFGTADATLRVTRESAASTGLTHLYVMSDRALDTDDCIALREIDRLDRNPFNHQQYEAAHVLYRVDRLCGETPK